MVDIWALTTATINFGKEIFEWLTSLFQEGGNMNSVELIGNLVRDPSYKEHTQGDRVIQIAKYTIAASRLGKKDEADF